MLSGGNKAAPRSLSLSADDCEGAGSGLGLSEGNAAFTSALGCGNGPGRAGRAAPQRLRAGPGRQRLRAGPA